MRKILPAVIVFLIFVPMFGVFTAKVRAQGQASETVIFQDDFESYPVGSFHSDGTMGDWLLVWGAHAGDYPAQALISDEYAYSGNRSLEAKSYNTTSDGHCSAVIKRDCSTSSNLIGYEVYVMCLPGGGCDVGFFNGVIATWGTYYAVVSFLDSYIWAGGSKLQPFTAYEWYKISVILNRNTRVFDVWVNDVLEGRNIIEPNDPWQILSMYCGVSFNLLLPAYFDNVKTFAVNDTAAPNMSEPEQSPLDGTVGSYENVTVSTNVTDSETAVCNITMWYRVNDTGPWEPVNMTCIQGNTYQACIQGFGQGTNISYYLTSYDLAGNQATVDNSTYYYHYMVVPEIVNPLVLLLLVTASTTAIVLRKKRVKTRFARASRS